MVCGAAKKQMVKNCTIKNFIGYYASTLRSGSLAPLQIRMDIEWEFFLACIDDIGYSVSTIKDQLIMRTKDCAGAQRYGNIVMIDDMVPKVRSLTIIYRKRPGNE